MYRKQWESEAPWWQCRANIKSLHINEEQGSKKLALILWKLVSLYFFSWTLWCVCVCVCVDTLQMFLHWLRAIGQKTVEIWMKGKADRHTSWVLQSQHIRVFETRHVPRDSFRILKLERPEWEKHCSVFTISHFDSLGIGTGGKIPTRRHGFIWVFQSLLFSDEYFEVDLYLVVYNLELICCSIA